MHQNPDASQGPPETPSPADVKTLNPPAPDKSTKIKQRRWRFRFRLMDLLWLSVLTAILILWYKDHQSLMDQIASANTSESWSVRQALGKPDTSGAGDFTTAWASASPDSGDEWLIVEFPRAVIATQLQIEETYNPGAVNRVCAVDWRGNETEVWKGKDPVKTSAGRGSSKIPISPTLRARRFKIYLESGKVSGWNEIDAVALLGKQGSTQWATNAWASSSFGENQLTPSFFWP